MELRIDLNDPSDCAKAVAILSGLDVTQVTAAPVQVAQPATPVETAQPAAPVAAAPAPAQPAAPAAVTMAMIEAKVQAISAKDKGLLANVKTALDATGSAKIGLIPAEQFQTFFDAIKELA